jgi:hypothetical protein
MHPSDFMLVAMGVVMALIGLMSSTSGEESGKNVMLFLAVAGICFAMAFRGMLMH